MTTPQGKEQAFMTAKSLADEMGQARAGMGQSTGLNTFTQMRDQANADYIKLVNGIGSGQALAEINKKVDYTSDIDKTIQALQTKKATVAQDVFERLQKNAGSTPINYLEAEKIISSQEQNYENQIGNLMKVRDSRKQTVLDYAKNIEDSRTKTLEVAKNMVDFYDKKVTEAQQAVKDGVADYKWLVDAQQKQQEAQRDYDLKARDMNVKEGDLRLKMAESFKTPDGIVPTGVYQDTVGIPPGGIGGQCGSYVNKQLGTPGLFGDTLASKKNATNTSIPTPGSAFVMNTGSQYGHVGIVKEVLTNGQLRVVDSNFKADQNGNGDGVVREHIISTNNIVGYYDPNIAKNGQVQNVAQNIEAQVKDYKNKGMSMEAIRSTMKGQYGKAYDSTIEKTIADNYGTDSDYVKGQNFFDNLLNLDTIGKDPTEIMAEIKQELGSNNQVVKDLKLATSGDGETQQVLAQQMVERYITPQGGKFGTDDQEYEDTTKKNAQVLAKMKTLFPAIQDSEWKTMLEDKGVKSSWYSYVSAVNDEQDDIFEQASEFMKK